MCMELGNVATVANAEFCQHCVTFGTSFYSKFLSKIFINLNCFRWILLNFIFISEHAVNAKKLCQLSK